jgi:hypothetical protein
VCFLLVADPKFLSAKDADVPVAVVRQRYCNFLLNLEVKDTSATDQEENEEEKNQRARITAKQIHHS